MHIHARRVWRARVHPMYVTIGVSSRQGICSQHLAHVLADVLVGTDIAPREETHALSSGIADHEPVCRRVHLRGCTEGEYSETTRERPGLAVSPK